MSEKQPNASRLATPNAAATRCRAIAGGEATASGDRLEPQSPSASSAGARISTGSSRPSKADNSGPVRAHVSNSPVETSSQAAPSPAAPPASASSKLRRPPSSKASSVIVPGVISRTTARRIGALPVRSFGFSICSATATRKPRRISRPR